MEGQDFDKDGIDGCQGKSDQTFFVDLNSMEYYRKEAPKSLGKEWFKEVFFPTLSSHGNIRCRT